MSDDDIDQRARERVDTMLGDKWKLERLLGIGGMAAVYEGRHRNGARAAIKVLHPALARHPEVRERFLREGYAANKVEHPGVVKVMDDDVVADGPDAGAAYIVMELLEGESLQERLERGPPLAELEFLRLADGVLEVLEAAHSRGVVHRDLKPENLFLARSEELGGAVRVKVLDFGLARLLDGATITSYGLALGTPSFMSPEQAAGRTDEIDGRTDIFAIGATGFRVRTGRRVQEGANAVELVTKMANFSAPPIRGISPEVSEPYARVIDRALQFKREDRYPDAASMRQDVRKAIAELDGNARTVLAEAVPASRSPLSSRAAPPPPPVRGPAPSGESTVELSGGDLEAASGSGATADAGSRPTSERPTAIEGKLSPAPLTPVSTSGQVEREDAALPKRRSVLPWLTVAVFIGIGVKLWMDAHPETSPVAPIASALATVVAPKASVIPTAPPPSVAATPVAPASAAVVPSVPASASAAEATSAVAAASASAPAAESAPGEPDLVPSPTPSASASAPTGSGSAGPSAVAVAMPPQSPVPHASPAAGPRTTHPRPPAKVGPGNVHVLGSKHHNKKAH